MKAITNFKIRDEYSNRVNYASVKYNEKNNTYELAYKYSTMEKESIYTYDKKELAMYDYIKKVMFLLS